MQGMKNTSRYFLTYGGSWFERITLKHKNEQDEAREMEGERMRDNRERENLLVLVLP